MQSYADHMSALDWNAPQHIDRKSSEEVAHYLSIFRLDPQIACQVSIHLKTYELNAKRFTQLLEVFTPLMDVYETLEGKSLAQCDGCELPDVSNTNALLKDYFMREPFPAARKQHAAQFENVCLDGDHLTENRETIESHENHAWQPGLMNPLHPSHAGCGDVWQAALSQKYNCSRYPETPRYLICPRMIWDTDGKVIDAKTTKPFSRFTEGVLENIPFTGGFILVLPGIFDVYWRPEEGLLRHIRLPPVKAKESPVFKDYDSNGLNDLSVGGMLFLANPEGTTEPMTIADFQRNQEQRHANEQRQDQAAQRRRSTEGVSLFEMEDQLGGHDADDQDLLDRAAARAEEWWTEVNDADAKLSVKVRVYWHQALWARATTGKDPHADFMVDILNAAQLDPLDARMKVIEKFYRKGDVSNVARQCAALTEEYKAITLVIAGLSAGVEAAEAELGALWSHYLSAPFPAAQAKSPAERLAIQKAGLEKQMSGWCR